MKKTLTVNPVITSLTKACRTVTTSLLKPAVVHLIAASLAFAGCARLSMTAATIEASPPTGVDISQSSTCAGFVIKTFTDKNFNGVLDPEEPVKQSSTVCDGSSGILEIINPCGENWANDEVLIRLANGRILALYDGGPNQSRLVLLSPGNYISTDAVPSKSCRFTITQDYQIINQVLQ